MKLENTLIIDSWDECLSTYKVTELSRTKTSEALRFTDKITIQKLEELFIFAKKKSALWLLDELDRHLEEAKKIWIKVTSLKRRVTMLRKKIIKENIENYIELLKNPEIFNNKEKTQHVLSALELMYKEAERLNIKFDS